MDRADGPPARCVSAPELAAPAARPADNVHDVSVFVVYTAMLVIPGLLLGFALGVRGWALAATSPLASYAVVAATGTVCALTGLTWSPATFAVATVLAVGLAFGARAAARRWLPGARATVNAKVDGGSADSGSADSGADGLVGGADGGRGRAATALPGGAGRPASLAGWPGWPGWRGAAVAIATVIGSAVGAYVLAKATGWLDVPPQDWDAPFHGNAIRYIADTGDADPAALAAINHYEDPGKFYYPNGWHLLSALVYRLSGGTVPAVFDASIVLIAPMLTVGLVGLLHRFRARAALAASAALLSGAASAIPYDLIQRGPLITYATGVVLVPAFLVMLHRAVADRSVPAAVLAAASAAALQVIHPGSAIVAAIFAAFLVAERWLLDRRVILRDAAMLAITGAIAALLSVPALLGSLNSVSEAAVFVWPADQPAAWAVGDLIGFSHLSIYPRWFLVIPLFAGLMLLRPLRPMWWLLGGSAVFGGLFLLAASYSHPVVAQLTRPWWGDKWRLIAVFTIGAIVLAAHGVVVISDELRRRVLAVLAAVPWRSAAAPLARAVRAFPVVPVLVLGVIAVGSDNFYHDQNLARVKLPQFSDGPGLTKLERDGISALAKLVPPGARVMNQNSDGSAWMYALAGVQPVYGHLEVLRIPVTDDLSQYALTVPPPPTGNAEAFYMTDAQQLLHKRFNRIDTDPQVRAAAERLNVQYVFVGRGYVRGYFRRADGLRELDLVRSLQLVYDNPDVRIYRLLPQPSTD